MRRPAAQLVAVLGTFAATAALAAPARPGQQCSTPLAAYDDLPTWTAAPQGFYGTGVALADIDGDGFEDIVVSNGNDMAAQPLVVYLNHPGAPDIAGRFGKSSRPDWQSEDSAYMGNLAVGDIDGDGCLDVAVSLPLSKRTDHEVVLGGVNVYFNRRRANGDPPCEGLSPLPGFTTVVPAQPGFVSTACALGDADGDGDLDLVVAVMTESVPAPGGAATSSVKPVFPPAASRIYLNRGGKLSDRPGWTSKVKMNAASVVFADVDGDGLMDLVFGAPRPAVFYGGRDARGRATIARSPGWRGVGPGGASYSVDVGRLAGRAVQVVAASFTPLWASEPVEPFELFAPARDGSSKAPVWQSSDRGRGSQIKLASVGGGPSLDLLAGRWSVSSGRNDGAPIQIYRGLAARSLCPNPSYVSKERPVAQAIAVGSLARPAARRSARIAGARVGASVLTLDIANVDAIVAVRRNGRALSRAEFTSVPGRNWVSLKEPVAHGDIFEVDALATAAPDMAVADWNPAGRLAVYFHRALPEPRPTR